MTDWEATEKAEKQIDEFFEKHSDEFIEFDRVKNKKSTHRDLHAFILLNEIAPSEKMKMVAGADHDIIWLATDLVTLSEKATDEQLIELCRCGVHLDSENECLAIFV